MFKKYLIPLGISLAGVLTISVLVIAKPQPVPRPPAEAPGYIEVRVTQAAPQSARLTVHAQGTVTPKREIDLVAQVSGQIVGVEPGFVSGGFFAPSQTLVRIDDRDYKAAVVTAKAQVAAAEERLAQEWGLSEQARREWRDLGSRNANDLFLRKPQLAAAEANLESAQAALTMARLDLERTRISVPFQGRVKSIAVNLGQYVTAGTPLATVYDSTVLEVRLPLTEQQASLLDLPFTASSAGVANGATPATISGTLAGKPYQWQGVLARTEAFMDANSRMYYAIVEVSDPFAETSATGLERAPLLPGLFVQAEIAGKQLDNLLRLPRAALFERDTLLVLDGENKVVEQKVNVLRKSETEVWVQTDIAENTLITLEKQSLLTVGNPVEPVLPEVKEAAGEEAATLAMGVTEADDGIARSAPEPGQED